MVNGYLTLPTKLVEAINSRDNDAQYNSTDSEIYAQLVDIIRLGKPIYINGVRISNDQFLSAQLSLMENDTQWWLAHSFTNYSPPDGLTVYITIIISKSVNSFTVYAGIE